MTIAGWITMIASLAFVWGLTIVCFRKVLRSPKEEKAPPGFGA
jgi:hypothetical protein